MSSGITVNQECIDRFKELKQEKKLKYILFHMNQNNTEIVVKGASGEKDYDHFVSELPEDDCRYAVYDLEYDTPDGRRNKIIFFSWTPDNARIKPKMLFASSKETIKRALDLTTEVQATDSSEVSYEAVLAKFNLGK